MAARLGTLWFGDPTAPDEDAATQLAHATTLTNILIQRSHMAAAVRPTRQQIIHDEPLEAEFARRGQTLKLRQPSITATQPTKSSGTPLPQPPIRRDGPTVTPQPRI